MFVKAGLEAANAQFDDPLPTGVILSAFEDRHGGATKFSGHEWGVTLGELLLQGFRGGGDDYPLAGSNSGNKIGKRFSRSRAGLDDEVSVFSEGIFNGFGHFDLTFAQFAASRECSGDGSKVLGRGGGDWWAIRHGP